MRDEAFEAELAAERLAARAAAWLVRFMAAISAGETPVATATAWVTKATSRRSRRGSGVMAQMSSKA